MHNRDPVSETRRLAASIVRMARTPAFWVFLPALLAGYGVGRYVPPTWTVEKIALDVHENAQGRLYYVHREQPVYLDELVPLGESGLSPERLRTLNRNGQSPEAKEEYVYQDLSDAGGVIRQYFLLRANPHWRYWSLLPAVTAVLLCWMTREPLAALFGGIVTGALLLSRYDITGQVLVRSLMSRDAAQVLILYLWLLGGLMGVWSRTGAAQAFADLMTRRIVRGPRSAKLVAWLLGVVFFQGGTVSTVLVGTTVKPLADREGVSHEELSYVVDSTASPIALLLAFNAWPGYVQALIFVAGVPWLATEADRVAFFFKSVPLFFYAWFAVAATFLLSIERAPLLGGKMRAAIARARETGQLDAPDAEPLSAKELQTSHVPPGYRPHVIDFFVPLVILIGIAVGTFIQAGSPEVHWAFGAALLSAIVLALLRGMNLRQLMEGFADGLKGVVLGSVVLLLAITIGRISEQTGAGIFLVELLGSRVPYWMLPVMMQAMTMIIAFSTGTSWGTFAVAFPLAMPLAWAVACGQGLDHPQLFMAICFAAVLNGSVYGDQCSPISDTTVLSAMCTGCDLMDHVKTQLPQATAAAALAAVCWTAVTVIFV